MEPVPPATLLVPPLPATPLDLLPLPPDVACAPPLPELDESSSSLP